MQCLGPALLVYNDAMFTEDDFKSIQRIGDSIKKTEETKAKIGALNLISLFDEAVRDL